MIHNGTKTKKGCIYRTTLKAPQRTTQRRTQFKTKGPTLNESTLLATTLYCTHK
jgi:hypothetical protein